MNSLVGYTGFVGSNIARQGNFDRLYNSQNIAEAFGTEPDLLVYAGVRAEKFLANRDPEMDLRNIETAFYNIKKIKPKKLVLISTIDVYKNPRNVDEDSLVEMKGLDAYGYNRCYLERLVEQSGINYMIVRLPALYGKNIKKNFIYDMIKIIPSLLTESKLKELGEKNEALLKYYVKQENGFYKCTAQTNEEKNELKQILEIIGFTAMNFTDSRGVFQFYNLSYVWEHIQKGLIHDIKILNLATEPVKVRDLYRYINQKEFINEITDNIPYYDYRTKHVDILDGNDGYIFSKEFVMKDIKQFIEEYKNNEIINI